MKLSLNELKNIIISEKKKIEGKAKKSKKDQPWYMNFEAKDKKAPEKKEKKNESAFKQLMMSEFLTEEKDSKVCEKCEGEHDADKPCPQPKTFLYPKAEEDLGIEETEK